MADPELKPTLSNDRLKITGLESTLSNDQSKLIGWNRYRQKIGLKIRDYIDRQGRFIEFIFDDRCLALFIGFRKPLIQS